MFKMEDGKREMIIVNQFMHATGLREDEAKQLLEHCKWDTQSALSMFFEQVPTLPVCKTCNTMHPPGYQVCVPSNTPATPPSFEPLIINLGRINAKPAPSPLSMSP